MIDRGFKKDSDLKAELQPWHRIFLPPASLWVKKSAPGCQGVRHRDMQYTKSVYMRTCSHPSVSHGLRATYSSCPKQIFGLPRGSQVHLPFAEMGSLNATPHTYATVLIPVRSTAVYEKFFNA